MRCPGSCAVVSRLAGSMQHVFFFFFQSFFTPYLKHWKSANRAGRILTPLQGI
jgi:hypothetical protein